MKIGIIGSGVVAQTLGSKLVGLGHDLILGTRDPSKLDDKKMFGATLRDWKSQTEGRAQIATFKEAAAHGDLLINATSGPVSLEALKLAAADKVGAKVLLDVANELDASKGMPPAVLASQERCLAEKLQAAFPTSRLSVAQHDQRPVMVDPKALGGGDHTVFVSGNDAEAKATVIALLSRSAGPTCSTSAIPPRAGRRCTWRCGSGSGVRRRPVSSTSKSCADRCTCAILASA